MNNHSPGPWVENPVGSGILRRCQVEDIDGNIVAEVSNMNEDSALIAAAPEMLEALESIAGSLNWIIDQASPEPEMIDLLRADQEKIKAAISKAKGENND